MSDWGSRAVTTDRRLPAARLPEAGSYLPAGDTWQGIADEVTAWIGQTADAAVAELMEGTYAPFSAKVTQERQAAYFADLLFDARGFPAAGAWQTLFRTAGARGLAEAVKAARRWREQRGQPVIAPPPLRPGPPPGTSNEAREGPPPGPARTPPAAPPVRY